MKKKELIEKPNKENKTKPRNGMELFRDKYGNYIVRDSFWTVGHRDFEY